MINPHFERQYLMSHIERLCPECGSTEIVKDATAAWDQEARQWVLLSVNDFETCQNCGTERDDLSVPISVNISDSGEVSNGDIVHPPGCTDPGGHSWVIDAGSGSSYCEFCNADDYL